MRLFLTSKAISSKQSDVFLNLVGKTKPSDIKIALIENAADVYEADKKAWMYDNRQSIQANGFVVDLVDLEEYRQAKKGLPQRLSGADVIWLGGGNTFYLRWILKETKADRLIVDLVKKGKVYGGGSAGAIIAGPTLKYFEAADDSAKAPEVIVEGLGLTQTVVVPHWGGKKYGPIVEGIAKKLQADNFTITTINDEQALVVNGSHQHII